MRIVCISDTHGFHDKVKVPEGDVLVHAGDFSRQGTLQDAAVFGRWLGRQPHKHIVVVPGNHDLAFEEMPDNARYTLIQAAGRRRVHVLNEDEVTIEGRRFWGSPWTPWFHDWAFNAKRGPEIRARWAKMPEGIAVAVTHGPPFCKGDMVSHGLAVENVGCVDLRDRLWSVKPLLHVCGHIHEGAGRIETDGIIYVNASVLNERYQLQNPPIVVDLPQP